VYFIEASIKHTPLCAIKF